VTLAIDRLTVLRGRRRILDGVSFEVRPGEIVAVVGPNGAGKTTLLEAIVGLMPSTGTIVHEGRAIGSFRERSAVFSFMPDEAALPEELRVGALVGDTERFGTGAFRSRSCAALSRGESKRVWLELTTALARPVAVLDEPFGAFDPLQLDEIVPAFRAAVKSAIVTVHQMAIAEAVADRMVILAAGRVVAAGTLAALREEAELPEGSLDAVFRALLMRSHAAA
jgi:ABC-type multidrug transport system ATPase subunit